MTETYGDAHRLETGRLVLRRFGHDDAGFALQLHQNPDLLRFIPSAALDDLDGAHSWIHRIQGDDAPGRGWWCVTLRSGAPVAAILLKPVRPSAGRTTDDVEIGWRQHAGHTGHGYVTEAAEAVLRMGLATGLPRVVAVVDPHNARSQRVCERLGMAHLGRSRDYYDEDLEVYEARG